MASSVASSSSSRRGSASSPSTPPSSLPSSRRPSASSPRIRPAVLSPAQVSSANASLSSATPQEILRWAVRSVPGLYQTTAFGLTGCVALDMISRLLEEDDSLRTPELVFIDTTYHFPETVALAQEASSKYRVALHIFRPQSANSDAQFEALYGQKLWEREPDSYDWIAKVEPARRAYEELGVRAVITGRRRSQGADRGDLPIVEVDETGLVKINPLASWTFAQVSAYAKSHNVPTNPLLERGYKSIGDWHSTRPSSAPAPQPSSSPEQGSSPVVKAGDDDERAGRWQGQEKTECGLHEDYFAKRRAFLKRQREAQMAVRDAARGDGVDV